MDNKMFRLNVPTKRGVVLNGVLFRPEEKRTADTVMIAITGIHGNFYSNPFYYNIGDTLNNSGIDFIYAQTNDAFGQIRTVNVHTGQEELIGSWNERFAFTDEDIEAYLDFAEREGYEHIILGGHSLGANKVIYYLSRHHDPRVEHFFFLSPANLTHMMSGVSEQEKSIILEQVERGDGDRMLPFPFMGWVECIANTAWDWQFSGLLNNVHTAKDGDFSQAAKITHSGALLVGTYDNFTDGDPSEFLRNLNDHMPTSKENRLIFIEKTGHTYQRKNQEVADRILRQLQEWGKVDMPFLVSKVNISVSPEQEQELKARLGRAIGLVPGKSEEYLFLCVEDKCHLWQRGESNRPMGYLTVSIFGNESHAGYQKFTAAVTDIYRERFKIAPGDFYIKFDDITAWSVGGQYIDRRMFQ